MRFRGARGNGNCPRRRALDGLLGLSRSLRCCYSMATAQDKAVGEMGTMRVGRLATAAGGRRGLPGCMSAPAAMPQPLWQANLKGRDHGAAAGWMGWRSCPSARPSHHLSGVFVWAWALLARLFGRVAQKRGVLVGACARAFVCRVDRVAPSRGAATRRFGDSGRDPRTRACAAGSLAASLQLCIFIIAIRGEGSSLQT